MAIILQSVRAWAVNVWYQLLPDDVLLDAWKQAQREVGLAKYPQRMVSGGAGAFISTLRHLGWASPTFDSVTTREGALLHIREVDVKMILRAAEEDARAVLASHSDVARDFDEMTMARNHFRARSLSPEHGFRVNGSTEAERNAARIWKNGRYQSFGGRTVPWFDPAALIMGGLRRLRKTLTSAHRSVASLVEGGWWPQARLFTAGVVDTPICRACKKQVGTTWHRLAECDTTDEHRKEHFPKWLKKKAEVVAWDPLFVRGVPALPILPSPPPHRERWGKEGQPQDGAVATGKIYTDGSVRGRLRRLMRGGWGIAALSEEGKLLWTLRGTCGEWFPSTVRSELRAVLEALRRAVPPLTLHIDNLEVVHGFERGRAWCMTPNRDGVDLWRQIWEIYGEIKDEVTIKKVKAHTSLQDVHDGVIDEEDRIGN